MVAWARVVAMEVVQISQGPHLLSRLRQQDFLMDRCRMEGRKGEESMMSLRFSASMSRMVELQYTEIEEIALEQIPKRRSRISFWPYYFKCLLDI